MTNYDIKAINFGEEGSKASSLIKEYIRTNGKGSLSKLMRRLVITNLNGSVPTNALIRRRKTLSLKIGELLSKRSQIDEQLRERGVDPEIDI